ncbi:MAG TPA: C39 family peptidase [Acidiphilium sp.]|jgi:predicted double-glycine peptidase|nr:MAG: hypothetical protein B7Z76_02535 [Acidiphilium sp. 20-67-58]HQU11231.1 C39 family peptidase [Acidiphilium sp.]
MSGTFVRFAGTVALIAASCLASVQARADALQFALPNTAISGTHMQVRSWQDMKFTSTVHQKYDFSCGSAALATLLTYVYDVPVTEESVFKSMYRHGDQAKIRRLGFSLLDMKNYLARHHIPSNGFKASLAKLSQIRVPAIVLIDYHGYHHFVLVRGVSNGEVLISDPSLGLRAEPVATFAKQWSGIFFAITSDLSQARLAFNNPTVWQAVPQPPVSLAHFQLRDLGLPANGWQLQNTF